jgi:hypothetical protein
VIIFSLVCSCLVPEPGPHAGLQAADRRPLLPPQTPRDRAIWSPRPAPRFFRRARRAYLDLLRPGPGPSCWPRRCGGGAAGASLLLLPLIGTEFLPPAMRAKFASPARWKSAPASNWSTGRPASWSKSSAGRARSRGLGGPCGRLRLAARRRRGRGNPPLPGAGCPARRSNVEDRRGPAAPPGGPDSRHGDPRPGAPGAVSCWTACWAATRG